MIRDHAKISTQGGETARQRKGNLEMAQMTADQLATDILARQGHDIDAGDSHWREAYLTAKQTKFLFDLCDRAGYTAPVRNYGKRYAGAPLWSLSEMVGGSSKLRTYSPEALAAEDADRLADQADEMLDIWDAMHLQPMHDKLMDLAAQADALLDEYHAALVVVEATAIAPEHRTNYVCQNAKCGHRNMIQQGADPKAVRLALGHGHQCGWCGSVTWVVPDGWTPVKDPGAREPAERPAYSPFATTPRPRVDWMRGGYWSKTY